jgi:phospholipase/carboxylesterase
MSMYAERPAARDPVGALVLFHGRGADEYNLLGLLDELDPERRFDGYCPRAPLSLPPGGAHWYAVPRVGYPDPVTFRQGFAAASAFVDRLEYDRIVLGGFSQGAVMALSVGLGEGRTRPQAVVAFSGFLPEVDGWELGGEPFPPVAVAHGTYDEIIPVAFGHRTRDRLVAAGASVLYRESPIGHAIDPAFARQLREFVAAATTFS